MNRANYEKHTQREILQNCSGHLAHRGFVLNSFFSPNATFFTVYGNWTHFRICPHQNQNI